MIRLMKKVALCIPEGIEQPHTVPDLTAMLVQKLDEEHPEIGALHHWLLMHGRSVGMRVERMRSYKPGVDRYRLEMWDSGPHAPSD